MRLSGSLIKSFNCETTLPSSTFVAHSDLDAEMQARVLSLCYFRVLLVRRPTYCNYARHPLVDVCGRRRRCRNGSSGALVVFRGRLSLSLPNIATTNDTPWSCPGAKSYGILRTHRLVQQSILRSICWRGGLMIDPTISYDLFFGGG